MPLALRLHELGDQQGISQPDYPISAAGGNSALIFFSALIGSLQMHIIRTNTTY